MEAVLHGQLPAGTRAIEARTSAADQMVFSEPLRFDGKAAEYWRLWVLHLLLNLLSLGLYSPWAKRRRQQWFARHTVLLGDRFDYQARPWRLLIGRLIGLTLLGFYSLGQDFGRTLGLLSMALLLLLAPPLFAQAQRFKLRATRWRGMSFDYAPNYARAYASILPMLLVWLAPGLFWLDGGKGSEPVSVWVYGLAGLAGFLIVPWAHARLKSMQHRQASFMGVFFRFDTPYWGFHATYLIGLFMLTWVALVGAVVSALIAIMLDMRRLPLFVNTLLFGYVVYLMAWPVFATRLQRLSWNRTCWGPLSFHCEVRAWALWRLVLIHGPLVLLTVGLWWPVAAVAWARLRIGSMRVLAHGQSVASVVDALRAPAGGIRSFDEAGDASADLFNLDIGW